MRNQAENEKQKWGRKSTYGESNEKCKAWRANWNGREFKTHNPKGTMEMENGKLERRVAMESVKHWKAWKIRKHIDNWMGNAENDENN